MVDATSDTLRDLAIAISCGEPDGRSGRMRRLRVVLGVLVLVLGLAVTPAQAHPRHGPLGPFTHLVVIYQENHSFDNLYAGWGRVGAQRVDGRGAPGYARRSVQVRQDGTPYRCLYQNDPSLATPPLDA